MKTLKQNMTMSFNARRDHSGTIWEGRFYDRRSEPDVKAMSAQAAYVDCNPAEAGTCRDPADYRWCSWAAAVAGDEHARDMYRFIYGGAAREWREMARLHRAAIRVGIKGQTLPYMLSLYMLDDGRAYLAECAAS